MTTKTLPGIGPSTPTKAFYTETGSIYELDKTNKRIRRVFGVSEPTPRMGADGSWKTYERLYIEDLCAVIVWKVRDDGVTEATRTSRLVKWVKN